MLVLTHTLPPVLHLCCRVLPVCASPIAFSCSCRHSKVWRTAATNPWWQLGGTGDGLFCRLLRAAGSIVLWSETSSAGQGQRRLACCSVSVICCTSSTLHLPLPPGLVSEHMAHLAKARKWGTVRTGIPARLTRSGVTLCRALFGQYLIKSVLRISCIQIGQLCHRPCQFCLWLLCTRTWCLWSAVALRLVLAAMDP